MDEISKITGRSYHLFDYYGAADADRIIIAIGSVTDICKDVTDALNANGEKVGVLNVHLYRPFSVKHFLDQIPSTVKKIAVLDRTREPAPSANRSIWMSYLRSPLPAAPSKSAAAATA